MANRTVPAILVGISLWANAAMARTTPGAELLTIDVGRKFAPAVFATPSSFGMAFGPTRPRAILGSRESISGDPILSSTDDAQQRSPVRRKRTDGVPVSFPMAVSAEGNTVGDIETQIRELTPRFDVMGMDILGALAPDAVMAIPFQDSIAPLPRARIQFSFLSVWNARGCISASSGAVLSPQVVRVEALPALNADENRLDALLGGRPLATGVGACLLRQARILVEGCSAKQEP